MDDKINVLVASEYILVRLGITTYLKTASKAYQVIQADSLSAAAAQFHDHSVDVAVVDLAIVKPSGLSAIKSLLKQDPAVKIIVLSRNEKEPFITKAIENGALGYISLKSDPIELIEAIQAVYRNEKYLSKDVAYGYAIANLNRGSHELALLTTREYQVFTHLAQGKSVNEISVALFISPKTVHVYRSNIFEKLKVSSCFELTLMALKSGVISIDVMD